MDTYYGMYRYYNGKCPPLNLWSWKFVYNDVVSQGMSIL